MLDQETQPIRTIDITLGRENQLIAPVPMCRASLYIGQNEGEMSEVMVKGSAEFVTHTINAAADAFREDKLR